MLAALTTNKTRVIAYGLAPLLIGAVSPAVALPVEISGTWRLRYEAYANPVGLPQTDFDDALPARLLLAVKAGGPRWHVLGELQDSRTTLDSDNTPIGTDDVNAAEALQAYVGWTQQGLWAPEDRFTLQAGRMTIDSGSRRFVARNRFRNTLNAFTGVQARWLTPTGEDVQAFLVLPVDRLPNRRDLLANDSVAPDVERLATVFAGLHVATPNVLPGFTSAGFVYALSEDDTADSPTRNRDLWTFGFRLLKDPAPARWDAEFEAALQLGSSHATTLPLDRQRLQHRAGFLHAGIGYTPAHTPALHIDVSFDFASGDADPNDKVNHRFDTLYGARRWELGPTGTYGLIARSNLLAPALRAEWKADERTRLMLMWRPTWLAAERDALVSTGQRDRNGESGRFVGHQVELMGQHSLIPKRLELEAGITGFAQGEFLREVARATDSSESVYGYVQGTLKF